ncbi:MAG: hypothetical protein WCK65_04580 [Rhodospirillaceae bacterium]
MSNSYIDGKVREALLVTKGSRSLAQNQLMVWAMKDDRLLKLMAQPFLKAISGAAIAGAIKRGITVPGLDAPPAKPRPSLSKEQLADILSQMGGGEVACSGDGEKPDAPRRPPAASTQAVAPVDQASTIRALAAVYAKNRKRPG